jgi:ABC-type bacteriocin/lantibiotic exporter with double-glycine peptidase domain
MSDLRNIESRVESLEYVSSLSLLESTTQNLLIEDADGFNRFKREYFDYNFNFKRYLPRKSKTDNKLHLRNVSYEYIKDLFADSIETIPIIKNLSFTFESKIYYLESPNGQGKSTLLKSIIQKIKNGTVIYNGHNLHEMSMVDLYRTVCYIKQSSDFMPKYNKETVTYFINKTCIFGNF